MPEGNTTQTSDAVLDAEQTEKVTAFLALAIKEFLEDTYADSDDLRTHGIEMDLQDHGKEYAIGQLYEAAQPEFYDGKLPQYRKPSGYIDMSWLKIPAEDTDEAEDLGDFLDELYFKALERVSWHVGMVVTIE
jgi:hypothetical protein